VATSASDAQVIISNCGQFGHTKFERYAPYVGKSCRL